MLIVSQHRSGTIRVLRGELADRLLHAVPYVDLRGRAAVRIGKRKVEWLHLVSSQGSVMCVARDESIRDEIAISAFHSIVDGRTKPKEANAASS